MISLKKIFPKITFPRNFIEKYLPGIQQTSTFGKLSKKDKMAMRRLARSADAFAFVDVFLPGMASRIMKNLATSVEGISDNGISRAERMRGQLAMISEIRKLFKNSREFKNSSEKS